MIAFGFHRSRYPKSGPDMKCQIRWEGGAEDKSAGMIEQKSLQCFAPAHKSSSAGQRLATGMHEGKHLFRKTKLGPHPASCTAARAGRVGFVHDNLRAVSFS